MNHNEKAIDMLSSIRKVSKRDAKMLLSAFGSIRKVVEADSELFLELDGIA